MANSTFLERFLGFLMRIVNLHSFPAVVLYLLMVALSPFWRKFVQPFQLRMVMIIYNFVCSALSSYAFYYFILAFLQSDDMFAMTDDPHLKHPLLIYWITKWIELIDTLFMILRHKERQISFLHVYHHASILLLSDLSYNLYRWPPVGFILSMNSFVHIFLYLYYGQSALFSGQQPIWKKLLTQLQILQFLIGLIYMSIGYAYHGFCIYGIFYGFSMLFLFSNFYYWAFIHKKTSETKKKEN